MSDNTTVLSGLIQKQKQESFTHPANADDEDALGILIARLFEWDGDAILRTAAYALEDANFHTEAEKVMAMLSPKNETLVCTDCEHTSPADLAKYGDGCPVTSEEGHRCPGHFEYADGS